MKKFLNNFYYGMLNGWSANYNASPKLNVLLFYLENIGIKSITFPTNLFGSSYYVDIEFKDGTRLHAWNVNRWYNWMNCGNVKFSNVEKLEWENCRPSHEILYKYHQVIKKYEKELKRQRYQEDSDFSKYLPKGYAKRMERLKKLQEIEKHLK